jgi:hypothetical protein
MAEIEANDFNLNISRYVSTAEAEVMVDLSATHKELIENRKADLIMRGNGEAQRIPEGTWVIPIAGEFPDRNAVYIASAGSNVPETNMHKNTHVPSDAKRPCIASRCRALAYPSRDGRI